MAWRVHANPVVLAVGGVAAVVLELAEPRVRTGVWAHSNFRSDPLGRMRRTAQAALLTTFGPTALAQAGIEAVARRHAKVEGVTADGEAYSALDPTLGDWVHVTAGYGFLTAYRRLLAPQLSPEDADRYWAEGRDVAAAYGAGSPPGSHAQALAAIAAMKPRLRPSPVIDKVLHLVGQASPFGPAGRPLQALVVEAAIACLPPWAIGQLSLPDRPVRRAGAVTAARTLAQAARTTPLPIVSEAYARMSEMPPP
ncbi:MAG TPA: oxygenase MpaB family protein [Caulobacteraceae bacterium]|jgi:uncharacterized protein (DUF2236 family)